VREGFPIIDSLLRDSQVILNKYQDRFYTYGGVSLLGGNSFRIEDLPINIWTENFKKKLASTPFVQVNDINNY
jgi:hypothetical protein